MCTLFAIYDVHVGNLFIVFNIYFNKIMWMLSQSFPIIFYSVSLTSTTFFYTYDWIWLKSVTLLTNLRVRDSVNKDSVYSSNGTM